MSLLKNTALIFGLAIGLNQVTYAQGFDKMDQKTLGKPVYSFVEQNQDFSNIEPSCPTYDACSNYNYHVKNYTLDIHRDDIFEVFATAHPKDIWAGDTKYKMTYNKSEDQVYHDVKAYHPPVETGMVLFLELKIIPLYKIPVVFELITIDLINGVIEFSYVKGNKSLGIQRISLVADGNQTKVIHETRFSSGSKFRDTKLYPFFHTKLIDGFYKNIVKFVKNKK